MDNFLSGIIEALIFRHLIQNISLGMKKKSQKRITSMNADGRSDLGCYSIEICWLNDTLTLSSI
jgi:hypothetical protein